MEIYPAIDLYQGKVVRLREGNFSEVTVYSDHPEKMAQEWKKAGAQWIHVVDLEGARDGRLIQGELVRKIRAAVDCKIQYGGGARTIADIAAVIKLGADRVVLGTKALDRTFLAEALDRFGSRLVVGLDAKDGKVRLEGWMQESNTTIGEAVTALQDMVVRTVIVTDIATDGTLLGPNFKQLENVLTHTRSRVILSGGVSSLDDIRKAAAIKDSHFDGVIIGKALYEKKFHLDEALKIARAG